MAVSGKERIADVHLPRAEPGPPDVVVHPTGQLSVHLEADRRCWHFGTRAPRLPLLAAGTALASSYLTAEQELGRIAPTADIATLSPTLIGAVHLLFADHESGSPDAGSLHKAVATVVAGAIANDRHGRRRSARSDCPSA